MKPKTRPLNPHAVFQPLQLDAWWTFHVLEGAWAWTDSPCSLKYVVDLPPWKHCFNKECGCESGQVRIVSISSACFWLWLACQRDRECGWWTCGKRKSALLDIHQVHILSDGLT